VSEDLAVPPGPGARGGLLIPAEELLERFSRSSGPGGQGVNTTDSRVELRWDIATSTALTTTQRDRLLDQLSGRLVDGALTIAASEHRSQLQNRMAARARLVTIVRDGLTPTVARRPTRPTKASKTRRLDAKSRRANIKSGRGRVRGED
jgi:ribosome-associated protein